MVQEQQALIEAYLSDETKLSGKTKLQLCQRLGKSWQDLAIILEIPSSECKQFEKGRECLDILNWLDERNKLGKLYDALSEIDRDDLVLFLEEEKSDDHSHTATRIVLGNKTIEWFIALTIGILVATDAHSWAQTEMKFAKYWFTKNQGVRANYIPVIAYNTFRIFDGFEKKPEKQPPVSESSSVDTLIDYSEKPLEKQSLISEPSSVDELKVSYTPFEYTINEHQPQFIKDAQTSLSVIFQNIDGEDFVSLNISPTGEQSFVRAVLSGYTEEFKSSVGVFNVQILSIDYDNKKVVVQVSRKS